MSRISRAPAPTETELVARARTGDEAAFRALAMPCQGELLAHCYRMLGSTTDAEDAAQEMLLRAWRGLPGFEHRTSFRAWLYRIATNVCLDAIDRQRRRFLPVAFDEAEGLIGEPDTEMPWIEPFPITASLQESAAGPAARYELDESLELAFTTALQLLPPNERAALVVRDVLGFSAREASELLGTSTAAVNSALQRARRRLDEHLPERSQHDIQHDLGPDAVGTIVRRYVDTLERADVRGMLALLTTDATWSMPPWRGWYRGHAAIAAFLRRSPFTRRWRHLTSTANGQPAVAGYEWDPAADRYVARVLDVLTLRADRIASVTAFVDGIHVRRLGLPAHL